MIAGGNPPPIPDALPRAASPPTTTPFHPRKPLRLLLLPLDRATQSRRRRIASLLIPAARNLRKTTGTPPPGLPNRVPLVVRREPRPSDAGPSRRRVPGHPAFAARRSPDPHPPRAAIRATPPPAPVDSSAAPQFPQTENNGAPASPLPAPSTTAPPAARPVFAPVAAGSVPAPVCAHFRCASLPSWQCPSPITPGSAAGRVAPAGASADPSTAKDRATSVRWPAAANTVRRNPGRALPPPAAAQPPCRAPTTTSAVPPPNAGRRRAADWPENSAAWQTVGRTSERSRHSENNAPA